MSTEPITLLELQKTARVASEAARAAASQLESLEQSLDDYAATPVRVEPEYLPVDEPEPEPEAITIAQDAPGSKSVDALAPAKEDKASTLPATRLPIELLREPGPYKVEERQLTSIAALHSYSRRQAFNADETLIHLPRGNYTLVNLRGEKRSGLRVSSEYCWHPTDPDIMFGCAYNSSTRAIDTFVRSNVSTGEIEELFQVSGRALSIGNAEGSVSDDAKSVVLSWDDKLALFDLVAGKVIATMDKPGNYDWVGVSKSGEYIVGRVADSSSAKGQSMGVWDRDMKLIRIVRDYADNGSFAAHGDLATDADGDDWFVAVGRRIAAARLRDGQVHFLSRDELWLHGHISGRSMVPGRVAFSFRDGTYGTLDFLGDLDDRVVWGKTGWSGGGGYDGQPKATLSPSGRHIIYTTTRNGSPEDIIATAQ